MGEVVGELVDRRLLPWTWGRIAHVFSDHHDPACGRVVRRSTALAVKAYEVAWSWDKVRLNWSFTKETVLESRPITEASGTP